MADIVQVERTSKLILSVNEGTESDPVYKNRTLNYINPSLTDEKLYNFGGQLADLQKYGLNKIKRQNLATLEENV